MFTGLIEEVGSVVAVRVSDRGAQLQIAAPHTVKKIRNGNSVAVNGCCLTVSSHRGNQLTFDLLEETVARTNLRVLRPEAPVNLECALSVNACIGGHFVQGHVDCTSLILAFEEAFDIEIPDEKAETIKTVQDAVSYIETNSKAVKQ